MVFSFRLPEELIQHMWSELAALQFCLTPCTLHAWKFVGQTYIDLNPINEARIRRKEMFSPPDLCL